MARIRTIKPEFWTSGQVMECSPITRLLFIGLWNFADDAGRSALSAKTIKAQIFPSDDLSSEDVLGMLSELSKNGLISTYSVEGKEYFEITGWQHQRIDKPQKAKHPAPNEGSSTNIQRTFGVGKDLIGEERKGAKDAAPNGAAPSDEEADLFRRGKQILGTNSGGLIKKLVKAKHGSIAQARAALEQASTRGDARDYIGAIVNKGPGPPGRGEYGVDYW